MDCKSRPNRSDTHLSKEEESKMEEETRDYFEGIAPKRHTKPQRSDHDSTKYVDELEITKTPTDIPEHVEFQRLESDDPQKLQYDGSEAAEEFVETEYYKDLNCIDKQHHRTGAGFIQLKENVKNQAFKIEPDHNSGDRHASSNGNPATNDWIPVPTDTVPFTSDKPRRSDN